MAKDWLATLQHDGALVLPNDLLDYEVQAMEADALEALKQYGKPYPFGAMARMPLRQAVRFPSFTEHLISNATKEILAEDYIQGMTQWCRDIFVGYDTPTGKKAANGFLHFDRSWRFKYLYYLNDVLVPEQGPFSYVPGTHRKGKELREANCRPGVPYPEQKNHIVEDFPTLGYTYADAVPVYGKAGTLIVFDTDVFHLGGQVTAGSRLLVRSHSA